MDPDNVEHAENNAPVAVKNHHQVDTGHAGVGHWRADENDAGQTVGSRAVNTDVAGAGSTPPIVVAAVAMLRQADGHMLQVRKSGTDFFLLPGGKIEPGEAPIAAAVREVAEETGFQPTAGVAALEAVGVFTAPAANEQGREVHCHLFLLNEPVDPDTVHPAAEIAELRYFPLTAQDASLAPLSRDVVFPAVAQVLAARPANDDSPGGTPRVLG
ncbi:NUDIX domain-containing protein [Corynebacterium choanae]|uniref:Bifunctional nicotinamide mononucleotide adenylyltransferase/ADP-ribose pyrophosphatase n=1 Tax=Corynebacterium choanae TaxID=1862358 RepID=A0A3G6J530_9CORY|nr:NUDIX domain-containing protein [Corynebacterium choanae]AZA13195.1 bifunctional nicotinamide mononucleotide adenylyltransferase/ADP-ribose pyrophosphatase [Corynebacterium choanae]